MSLIARRIPMMFDHPHLNSDDPATHVEAIDYSLPVAEAWKAKLQTLFDDLKGELLVAVETHRTTPSPDNEDRANDLAHDLQLIDSGFGNMTGYHDERLLALVGQPGLTRTKEVIAELKAERTEWAARVGEFDGGTAPYRLKKGKTHGMAGATPVLVQMLHGGAIVELTPSQAKAWADKFEKVTEPEPPAKKKPITVPDAAPPSGGMRHTTEVLMEKRARQESS
jgi:hypothetical protein